MSSSDDKGGLVVAITHVDYSPSDRTQYVIRVIDHGVDGVEKTVRRPYHEFRELRMELLDIMKPLASDAANARFLHAIEEISFPSKRLFGSRTETVVKTRAEALDKWLTKVLLATHEYRKAQKRKSAHDSSFSTQGSVLVLNALRQFLTTDIEEIDRMPLAPVDPNDLKVVPMPKRHSMPMENLRSASPNGPNEENDRHTANIPGYAPSLSPRTEWSKEKSNSASSVATTRVESSSSVSSNFSSSVPVKSILKSNERPPSSNRPQRAKTRFEEPADISRSIARSSNRTSTRDGNSSFLKDARSRDVNSSFLKDARYAPNKPVVLKRLPSGNEDQIIQKAEAELQTLGLTRDTALMLLRYLDKFLAKAMIRQPGCYRITPDNWLAIDPERLCLELEEALFNPKDMQLVLQDDRTMEWRIPPALEGYIQYKWTMDNHKKASEESDDSGDESEVEIVSFRGKKKSRFSEHEIDEIEAMMSNGNASREQMKQLRRQLHEENWERYSRPGESARRGAPISDDEEEHLQLSSASSSKSSTAAAAVYEDSDSDIGENEDFDAFIQRKSQKLAGRLQGLV